MATYVKNISSLVLVVSRRTGVVAKIIDDYKFNRVQAAADLLSEFLDEALPELLSDTVILIPTISKNVRRRGFDHIRKRIAIKLSRREK